MKIVLGYLRVYLLCHCYIIENYGLYDWVTMIGKKPFEMYIFEKKPIYVVYILFKVYL
jgi:hypothetical protein